MNCQSVTKILGLLLIAYLPRAMAEDLPPGYEQLLQRGAMVSIDHPVFVSADEATISDDAWVLGVIIGGEARAYSLRLLNSHEVVNDVISDQPVAAVW